MTSGGREAVLAALRRLGTAEAGAIAARLKLHPTTVRVHLDALAESGLVTRARREHGVGRGRPPYVYSAPTSGEAGAARGYQALAAVLAESFGRGGGTKSERATEAGRRWAAARNGHTDQRAARRGKAGFGLVRLVRELDELGFEPRAHAAKGTTHVEMWSCPYWEIAREQPEVVCAVHRGLLEGMLDHEFGPRFEVELVPFVTVDYCLASVRREVGDAAK